jgi:hypothetical protein
MSVKLTGRRRFRLQSGGLRRNYTIVLQVEVAGREPRCIAGHIDSVDVRYWRDAQLEDMTDHETPAI